ncbi:MAG TPA: Rieske (2Fe-2S) protein [Kofleriaceae bacterium]|nr:Rieske (2Fe-2S) protein [Kofleriaceae bacterium]
MKRRGALAWLGGLCMAALGAALAVPALAFVTFPTRRRTVSGGEEPVDLGPLDTLPEGEPVRVAVKVPRRRDAWTAFTDVTLGAVWLVRSGGSVRAFSTVCPHAGCAVDWQKSDARFGCPCHDSAFRPDGERLSGPSPRGLDPLPAEVKDGRVHVSYKRYRQGVPDREET